MTATHRAARRRTFGLAMVGALFVTPAFGHVILDAPNGGEILEPGTMFTIRWRIQIAHNLQNWDLWYSTTGPAGPWIVIEMDLPPGNPAPGSVHTYEWTVPDAPTERARVRVRMDNSGVDYFDVSNGDFTIQGGVACEDVRKVKVKCRGGKLKAILLSGLPRDTVVNLTRDGVDTKEVTVDRRGKAKAKWKNQSGRHEVCLDECPDFCGAANCGG